jgi:hypothetical protein
MPPPLVSPFSKTVPAPILDDGDRADQRRLPSEIGDDMVTGAFVDLSWPAVGAAVLVYYLLGALWFTPLFGRAWDQAIGYVRAPGQKFSAAYYLVPLASSVLVTLAAAVLMALVEPEMLVDAVGVGLVLGLGVALPISVNNALTPHTPHPFRHGLITGGYHVVGVVAVALVLWLVGG